LRLYEIGSLLEPANVDSLFFASVDIIIPRGLNSPSAVNVPAGTKRFALILRCRALSGGQTMPRIRVVTHTAVPALLYAPVESTPIVVAGGVTVTLADGSTFPVALDASREVGFSMKVNPRPSTPSTLRVAIVRDLATAGDCKLSYNGSPFTASSLVVSFAALEETKVFSMRCMRVSNPEKNSLTITWVSGEVYATFFSPEFLVNASPFLLYLDPNPPEGQTAAYIALPPPTAANELRTVVTSHTATRIKLMVPVYPGTDVEFTVALDSGSLLQGIRGYFLPQSAIDAATSPDDAFISLGTSAPTSITLRLVGSQVEISFYFYTTSAHSTGTNVVPYFTITRVSGVHYLNADAPRMRLRAGSCAALADLDDATTVAYANSIYYNKDWYPESWAGHFYSHMTEVTYTCKPGYYIADAAKRADPAATVLSTLVRCEAKRWVGPALSCEPVTCGPYVRDAATTTGIQITPNSRGHPDRFSASIRVNCIAGYVVGQVAPVSLTNPVNLWETVRCSLSPGAPATAVTGVWLRPDGQTPMQCAPVDCGDIEHNTHAVDPNIAIYVENGIPQGTTTLDSVVTFSCSVGYEIDGGDRTARCMPNGYWAWTLGMAPVCNSLDCIAFPEPGEPEGDVHMDSITYSASPITGGQFDVYLLDTVATFRCKEGYRIRNSAGARSTTVSCTQERGWSSELPRCEVLQCLKLFAQDGSEVIYAPSSPSAATQVPYLTYGTYKCPVGFNAWGDPNRAGPALPKQCVDRAGTSGAWEGPETHCLIHICDEVPATNATVVYANNGDNEIRSYQSEAHYSCPPGFEVAPRSAAVRTCHEIGVDWLPAVLPTCTAVTCPVLRVGMNVDSVAYSFGQYGARRLGSRASFTCDDGYVIQDETTELECSPSGEWVHPLTGVAQASPTCARHNCKRLTAKRHGKVTYVDRGFGATFFESLAIVSCDAGYQVQPGRVASLKCGISHWAPTEGAEFADPVPPCVDINECSNVDCGAIYGPGSECVNTVGGYSCTPYIANYTMTINGEEKTPVPVSYPLAGPVNEVTRSVALVDTGGGDRLTFRVFTGESVAPWISATIERFATSRIRAVRYERLVEPKVRFPCTLSDVATVPNLPGFQRVTCLTAPGGGTGLVMSLYFCSPRRFTSSLSNWDGDETALEDEGVSCMWTRVSRPDDPTRWPIHAYSINYPPPTSTPSSLRSATFSDRTGTPNLVGRTTNGQKETVVLTGTNFFANPQQAGIMRVVFGTMVMLTAPNAIETAYKCAIDEDDAARSTVTNVYCEMDFESGLDLHFLIDVLGQSVITSDTFSFPIKLRVFNITGCKPSADPAEAHTTVACPTSGQNQMTVHGDGFLEPTAVYINGDECFISSRTNDYVHCTLPAGTGISLSVIVTSGSQYFEVPAMLSYAAPRITRMYSSQCMNVDSFNLYNCPRQGNSLLTIEGTNFGSQGATVYIGGVSCTGVRHHADESLSHSVIMCTLPQGSRTQRSVVVFQRYGELSTEQAYISYTQCSPGTQDINFGCEPCRAGTYTDTEGQAECKECAPGSYNSAAGMSSCSVCRSGTYSPVGSSSCTDCPKGTFSTGNAGSCTTCAVGTYSPSLGANTCKPCPYGGTSDADYAGCHCLSGFFLNHHKECESCMVGGDCTATGSTYFNVVPLAGYYPTAMATDTDAPRVLRFMIDIQTSYKLDQAFEYQSMLALIMRASYDDTGITRDRLQILTMQQVALPAVSTFDIEMHLTKVKAYGAAARALNDDDEEDEYDYSVAQANDEGGSDSDSDGGADVGHPQTVSGARVTIDVYPSVTIGGESAEQIYTRFLMLLRAPQFAASSYDDVSFTVSNASVNGTLFYRSFGSSVTGVSVVSGYSRSAFINFEPCLSSSCVGGLELCAPGYEGPLCTVCATGYSKKTTYLCERCGTLSERVGQIMTSLTIAIVICAILVFFSVHDTTKNLDLPRVIRSVSHVAYFKILVCAIQVWAIAAQFDFEWPGVLGSFMAVMNVAGNIGIDAITLDCFSTNVQAYGIAENGTVRPLFLTTIGAFVLPIFALLFPLFVLIPAYLVHRRRFTRELATVAYVAKLDAAADDASLRVSQQAIADAHAAAYAEAVEAAGAKKDGMTAAEKQRKDHYGRSMSLRTAIVKQAALNSTRMPESFDHESAKVAATLTKAARPAAGASGGVPGYVSSMPPADGRTSLTSRASSTEMQPLGTRSPRSGPLAPPAPVPMPTLHFTADDDDDDVSSEGGADELFTEFNIDLSNQANNASSSGSLSSDRRVPASRAAAVSLSVPRRAPAAASVSALGVSMVMTPTQSRNNAPMPAAAAVAGSLAPSASHSQLEFHVDDFVDDEATVLGGSSTARSHGFGGARRRLGARSSASVSRAGAHHAGDTAVAAAVMGAIQEEPSQLSDPVSTDDPVALSNTRRRDSLDGSEAGSAVSAAGSRGSRGSRLSRGKSFRETLVGPRLTARGLLKRDVVVHQDTDEVVDADRADALDAAGLGGGETQREPSRSMSRSQIVRSQLKRTPSASALGVAVPEQGTEYLQLQRDRRVFRFTVDRLAELMQAYQYIYICCIATALYLLHPNIARAFFRLIACKTVGGGSSAVLEQSYSQADGTTVSVSAADYDLPHGSRRFVLADMSLVCYSGEHFAWMFTLGLALFVFWIIGVPLGFFLYLRRNASLLRAQPNQLPVAELRQRHRVEYGFAFLFLGFQPKWSYWFVVEMARKVLYVAVSIFFPGQMHVQLLMSSFVAFSAISAQTAVRPFEQSVLEHFEFSSLLVTFILFFLANFYMIEHEINSSNRDAITAAIFTAFMLFFAVATIVLVMLVRQNRRTEQIRSAVTVALRRNIDPAPLLQTWRHEERKRRAAKKGKTTFDGDLRDMFIDNAEQDARLELDQYLDNEDASSSIEDHDSHEHESSIVSTDRSRSINDTAAAGDTAAAEPAADNIATAQRESSVNSQSGTTAAQTAAPASDSTTASVSTESSLTRPTAACAPDETVSSLGSVAAYPAALAAAAPSSSSGSASRERSLSSLPPVSHAAPSPSPPLSAVTAAVSHQPLATTSATATATTKKKLMKPKKKQPSAAAREAAKAIDPFAAERAAAVAAATAAKAAAKADAELAVELERAIVHPGEESDDGGDDDSDDEAAAAARYSYTDRHGNVDFLAQTIAQNKKEVAARLKQREAANKFGAVDVAEGRAPFSAPPAQQAAADDHASLFYNADIDAADEDELEDADMWAAGVTSGQHGYF
jgi:hypothetical protein